MRRPLFALTLAAAALAAAACSADTAPGWTYAAPTASPSAAPASAGASGSPGAGASAPASGGASAAPSGGAAGGAPVEISAMNIAFEQTSATAPADAAFTIHFNNKEAVPHNVDVKDASGASKFKGDVVTGPKEVDYQVPALPAGDYTFVCDVHPNMTGTLKVGG
jgi:plastocyanin